MRLSSVNGNEFIKRLKRYGKARGLAVTLESRHGKGSHGRLYLGDRGTTIKDRRQEISKGLLTAMLKQLGIDPKEF